MTLPFGTIVQGDALEMLRGWPDGCVQSNPTWSFPMVITEVILACFVGVFLAVLALRGLGILPGLQTKERDDAKLDKVDIPRAGGA